VQNARIRACPRHAIDRARRFILPDGQASSVMDGTHSFHAI
jgi:hypothetical protein